MGNESVKFRMFNIGLDTPSLFGEGRGKIPPVSP